MVSGKTVLLVVGAIVLIGVVTSVSIWRAKTEQSNRHAAEEMTAKWEMKIDSLQQLVDSLTVANQQLRTANDSLLGR